MQWGPLYKSPAVHDTAQDVFFAVATETFFEKPVQLQKKHPELYHELQGFYKVDPIAWVN